MFKRETIISLLLVFLISSCSPYKVAFDKEVLSEEAQSKYVYEGEMFSMFIYFHHSMVGEVVYVRDRNGVLVDEELKKCDTVPFLACKEVRVNNSRSFQLKFSTNDIEVESNTFISHRFILISKKGLRYKVRYTNHPEKHGFTVK